ncbi:MAG: hypothetical protein M3416_12900 [Acidobacteriota bacterium]|nr:hypothetical protein [Acidobacteriota bacterium]
MQSPTHVSAEQRTATPARGGQPVATLFTAFGVGSSYIFHVEEGERKHIEEYWTEIFKGHTGWRFDQLERYNKPLGETATFTVGGESCCVPAEPIDELQQACERELAAKLVRTSIEVIFFTTGVAVLMLRLEPKEPSETLRFCDALQDDNQLKEIRKVLQKIIRSCKDHYLELMNNATKGDPERKSKWTLSKFAEVDRENWDPKLRYSYPLFFVDSATYEDRIEKILGQVVGSQRRRTRQSDRARVSYQDAEIYVDWAEALVSNGVEFRELIENNFLIAFASWFALILMNSNSSIFVFEAFVGMVTDQPRSNADAVHQRSMAYIDVSDASLSIRWTTRRKDLFLLETIHRNWSSDRWRKNIEERMKLLALHYNRLEDERRAREDDRRKEEDKRRAEEAERRAHTGRRIAFVGILLTSVTLASAIADVINLAENDGDGKASSWSFLGFPLKEVDFYLTSLFLWIGMIGIILVLASWLWSRLQERAQGRGSQSEPPPPAPLPRGGGPAAESGPADTKTLPEVGGGATEVIPVPNRQEVTTDGGALPRAGRDGRVGESD